MTYLYSAYMSALKFYNGIRFAIRIIQGHFQGITFLMIEWINRIVVYGGITIFYPKLTDDKAIRQTIPIAIGT